MPDQKSTRDFAVQSDTKAPEGGTAGGPMAEFSAAPIGVLTDRKSRHSGVEAADRGGNLVAGSPASAQVEPWVVSLGARRPGIPEYEASARRSGKGWGVVSPSIAKAGEILRAKEVRRHGRPDITPRAKVPARRDSAATAASAGSRARLKFSSHARNDEGLSGRKRNILSGEFHGIEKDCAVFDTTGGGARARRDSLLEIGMRREDQHRGPELE